MANSLRGLIIESGFALTEAIAAVRQHQDDNGGAAVHELVCPDKPGEVMEEAYTLARGTASGDPESIERWQTCADEVARAFAKAATGQDEPDEQDVEIARVVAGTVCGAMHGADVLPLSHPSKAKRR